MFFGLRIHVMLTIETTNVSSYLLLLGDKHAKSTKRFTTLYELY